MSICTVKNPIANAAVIAALISIIGKMCYYHFLAPNEDFDMYTRFFYLFCFLAALLFGLREWKAQNRQSDFTTDVKTSMKITSVYALILSAFTYAYYKWINPAYFVEKIESRTAAVAETGADPEVIAQQTKLAETFFDAFTHSTITLFGILVIGFFYSIVLVMLFRSKASAFLNR